MTEVEAIELLVVENKKLRAENAVLEQQLAQVQWALTNYRRTGW